MFTYPVIVFLHLSNPTEPSAREVTHDYLGAGIGVELKSGLTIEGTLGAQSLGCMAPDCGRSAAATFSVTWRGGRRRR